MKLDPCPWCGGEMFVADNGPVWWAKCADEKKCGAEGPISKRSATDAIVRANRRASPTVGAGFLDRVIPEAREVARNFLNALADALEECQGGRVRVYFEIHEPNGGAVVRPNRCQKTPGCYRMDAHAGGCIASVDCGIAAKGGDHG